jgi:hypothetical protein
MKEVYLKFVKDCISDWSSLDKSHQFLYTSGGVLEEVWELKSTTLKLSTDFRKKIISEAGDVMWYITSFMIVGGYTDEEILDLFGTPPSFKKHGNKDVVELAIGFNKKVLKNVFYNQNISVKKECNELFGCVLLLSTTYANVTIDTIMGENIKKIDSRYPNGRETRYVTKNIDQEIKNMGSYD